MDCGRFVGVRIPLDPPLQKGVLWEGFLCSISRNSFKCDLLQLPPFAKGAGGIPRTKKQNLEHQNSSKPVQRRTNTDRRQTNHVQIQTNLV